MFQLLIISLLMYTIYLWAGAHRRFGLPCIKCGWCKVKDNSFACSRRTED